MSCQGLIGSKNKKIPCSFVFSYNWLFRIFRVDYLESFDQKPAGFISLDPSWGWVIINSSMRPIETMQNWVVNSIKEVGDIVITSVGVVGGCFRPPYRVWLILQQMEFIGVGSLFIVLLTGIFTGAVFTLQSVYAFSMFNMESMVGATVALALTRELSPVLTALMVTGRAGSAMATELGTMRVTEQIDALASMAVNPVHYLIVPRFIASVVMFPALTMLFNLVGVMGSYLVGVSMWGIDPGNFIAKIKWFVQIHDITSGLIKAAVFGGFVSLVSCYKGYRAEGGARGVGNATTQAVVIGSVSIMILDYFLTVLMF
jgi:phospholipid/cholesterol/gamma-HCH transport system permease protein